MALSRIEKISHYAVVVIAVSALVVSIWQGSISMKHNRLTVKPYLDFHIVQIDSTITVRFSNEGFGPAILEEISFFYEDEQYQSVWQVLEKMDEIDNWAGSFNYNPGTVVAPGAEKLLVSLKGGEHIRGVKVIFRYKSIYEESFDMELTF